MDDEKKWSGDEPQKNTAPPEATSLRFRCRRRSLVRQSLYLLLPPRQTAVKSRSLCVRHP